MFLRTRNSIFKEGFMEKNAMLLLLILDLDYMTIIIRAKPYLAKDMDRNYI